MKEILTTFLILCILLPGSLMSQHRDTRSDTWVAVDELQRPVADSSLTGGPEAGKTVGLFYYLWHLENASTNIHDITKILRGEEVWGAAPGFHHWGESLFGYYSMKDEFVIRKHMQMISDAGVDFIFLDNTNAFIYKDYALKLLQVMKTMKDEGYKVPQVTFILYNGDMDGAIEGLHEQIFSQTQYQDLFFHWEGKPLIIGRYTGDNADIQNGYTYRLSWAWTSQPWFTETNGEERWPWLDNYPQKPGLKNGEAEQIIVAAAQHPVGEFAIGKSTGADRTQKPIYGTDGKYFSLQWERALEVDPPLLMITQWNEWMAQRFIYQDENWHHPVTHMVRKPLKKGESIFVDVYSAEYSRDVEPLRTEYRDNMYLQMVSNIRQYKGSRSIEMASNTRTIKMDSSFSQWDTVGPLFLDDLGDVIHRDHVSYGSDLTYTNTSGRNDLDSLKVSFDEEYLYFLATTADTITSRGDSSWMLLLINADLDYTTGWNGYDFIINDTVHSADTTTLQSHEGNGFEWDRPLPAEMRISGRKIHVKIPAAALGINTAESFALDFKWVDNSLHTGDIIDLYVDGDAAPNHRFNYRYQTGPINIPGSQSYFPEHAAVLPGRLEVEHFDKGGEGIAYHDTDSVNHGGAYRTEEGVDIRTTPDSSGSYDVGWMDTEEWLEYIIYVKEEGIYDIHTRASAGSDSNLFHLELNGQDITGVQLINGSGDIDSFIQHDTSATIKPGHYILKLVIDQASGDFHLNYIDFSRRPTEAELRELECGPRLAWDFTRNDECWYLVNNLEGEVSDGIFTLSINGLDPFMYSSENVNIAARAYNALHIRMRNQTADTCAQLYWITGTNPAYSEAMSMPFPIKPKDPGFSDYRINLAVNPEWKGLITQIRLDPVCEATEGTVELDRMEFYADPSLKIDPTHLGEQHIRVWPNPASDHIFILLEGGANTLIRLTDLSGRIVYEEEVRVASAPFELNTGTLEEGIYLLRVSRDSFNQVSPIVIQH